MVTHFPNPTQHAVALGDDAVGGRHRREVGSDIVEHALVGGDEFGEPIDEGTVVLQGIGQRTGLRWLLGRDDVDVVPATRRVPGILQVAGLEPGQLVGDCARVVPDRSDQFVALLDNRRGVGGCCWGPLCHICPSTATEIKLCVEHSAYR